MTHTKRERLLILGAAGRDFHNHNVLFRENKDVEVVGFTATQIPHTENREYPASLAGPLYPNGLKVMSEDELEKIIKEQKVDRCLLCYSDLSHDQVMELAGRCLISGADFGLVAPERTMLQSCKPVVAVCAVRTGCGKSQASRYIIDHLQKVHGLKCVLVRHPMPYGKLEEQAVQRFEKWEDLDKQKVTIEEREEYEQHMKLGTVVYAGVDYERILRQAEKEADVIIWDGGNNDTPFYKPDLWVCVTDPHRLGHESKYFPGDINFRMADVILVNKANTATETAVERLVQRSKEVNPRAHVFVTDSNIALDRPELVRGKRVLLIEDGPTLTHGGMTYGAGKYAAEKYEAAEVVDPRPHLVGSLAWTYKKYPHLGKLIPAMGYFPEQIRDLEETINAVDADAVIIATPFDLCRVVNMNKPGVVAKYAVEDRQQPFFSQDLDAFVQRCLKSGRLQKGGAGQDGSKPEP